MLYKGFPCPSCSEDVAEIVDYTETKVTREVPHHSADTRVQLTKIVLSCLGCRHEWQGPGIRP